MKQGGGAILFRSRRGGLAPVDAMHDPFSLEPRGGDYVAYLKALQSGKIQSLGALAAQEAEQESSLLGKLARASLPGGAATGGQDEIPGETPSDRLRRRARSAGRKELLRGLSGICSMLSLAGTALAFIKDSVWGGVAGCGFCIIAAWLALKARR